MLGTIRNSRNLFSLTERLPKAQYYNQQNKNTRIFEGSASTAMQQSLLRANSVSQGSNGSNSSAKQNVDERQKVKHISKPSPQAEDDNSSMSPRNENIEHD